MTLDLFKTHLSLAAGRDELHVNGRIIVPNISIGQDTEQPPMVIVWETNGPDDCQLSIGPLLAQSSRVHYAAQRLGKLWPLLEAFYSYSGQLGSAAAGRVNINVDDHSNLPGLAFCSNDPASTLIPDAVFIGELGYVGTRRFFANGGLPWQSRKPQSIWRGTTTGNSPSGWRGLPRIKLCELSLKYPDLLDARISSIAQFGAEADVEIKQAGYLGEPVPVTSFGDWRVQIDIDGNTNSWSGLFQKLLTGSPVVKIASPGRWRQWYYDKLKPWENFVPAESSLSDLAEKLAWLRDHDAQAAAIGMAGRDLALSITFDSAIAESIPKILSAMRA